MQKLWRPWTVLSLYGMVHCKHLLLLNMSHTGCLVCERLWSEQCWAPCWCVVMHSFSGCESANVCFVMCIVCKITQDVGAVWNYCGVILVLLGWFLMVPSLLVLVFIQKTFCDLFLFCFFWPFMNGKRREVGGEAKGKMHGLSSTKYLKLCCSQRTVLNSNAFNCKTNQQTSLRK